MIMALLSESGFKLRLQLLLQLHEMWPLTILSHHSNNYVFIFKQVFYIVLGLKYQTLSFKNLAFLLIEMF